MKRPTVILAFAMLLYGVRQAQAEPITYTVSQIESGTLGAAVFTGTLVTISFISDTSTVFLARPGLWENDTGTATVNIVGIGTATFTDAMYAFDAQQSFNVPEFSAAGIGDLSCNGCPASVLRTAGLGFSTYDLKSAIGPVNGLGGSPDLNVSYATTAGLLQFTVLSTRSSTFTATTVPEPRSLVLLGIGLVGLIGSTRHRLPPR